MIAIGVVLILVALAVIAAAVFGGSQQDATLELGVVQVDTSALGIFLLGAGTLLVFAAGLELLRSGLQRGYRRRKELKSARKVVAADERRRGGTTGSGGSEGPAKEPPRAGPDTVPPPDEPSGSGRA